MLEESDSKLQNCVTFTVEQVKLRNLQTGDGGSPPFFLGINGVQGIGKTSLVSYFHISIFIHG